MNRLNHSSSQIPTSALPATGAAGVEISSHWPLLLLAAGTVLLKSLIFAPIDIWPVAYVCLVPWVLAVGTSREAPRVYVYSFLTGLAFFLINLRWLSESAGPWYVPLAAYMALFFPLMACPLRHAMRRRRMPLGLALAVIWTGCELIRAVAFSGFPWFFLSHSQYRVLPVIQIANLVGAYGVSFVVAAVNGAVADAILVLLARRRTPGRAIPGCVQAWVSAIFAGLGLIGALGYGYVQLGAGTLSPGPRIAVVQGDFLNFVSGDDVSPYDKMESYLKMMEEASSQSPDLYLLPESAWYMYLNDEFRDFDPALLHQSRWLGTYFSGSENHLRNVQRLSKLSFQRLQSFAQRTDATVVVGAGALFPTLYDLLSDVRNYNSAFVISPDGGPPHRYDKIHLVYFGEIVPFRFSRLRPLYFWLNAITPFSGAGNAEFSLFPGETFTTFTMKAPSQSGQTYQFATPICYEDVMPYVSRRFAAADGDRRVDFLLNISNDGWFGRGNQQAQHLAICVMRAVENRVGIARAVNTGISGFIDPNGRLHDLVGGDRSPREGYGPGWAVANVMVDSRPRYYSRQGDWFAGGCAALWLALFGDYFVVRAIARRNESNDRRVKGEE